MQQHDRSNSSEHPTSSHLIKLFDEAFSSPAAQVHRLEHTLMWLGEQGAKEIAAVSRIEPLMRSDTPPGGAWAIKARAAWALARIDPKKYLSPAREVLAELVVSSDFGKHMAGARMIEAHLEPAPEWCAPISISKALLERFEQEYAKEGAPVHFKEWFSMNRYRLQVRG